MGCICISILSYKDLVIVNVRLNMFVDYVAAAALVVAFVCLCYLCYTSSSAAADAAVAARKYKVKDTDASN